MAALVCEGVGKAFAGTRVLDGVDLTVPAGSLVALLGRSGSGKTTLLRVICGFEQPDAGRVLVDGEVVAEPGRAMRPERRRIGYVPQEGALFPHRNVADNVAFGLPRAARRRRAGVEALLALVGLPAHYAARFPHELSGGEQQRAALARALAPKPRLVLLDEPFSSLDATLRAETREAVARALAQAGATALLVTHDQAEALSMGAQVAVLRDGRMVQVASPAELYRRPADLGVARFVGDAIVLPGEARGGVVECALGRLRLALGMAEGRVQVMLRPEQIVLSAAEDGPVARVDEVTFYGHDTMVRLVLDAADGGVTLLARLAGHAAPGVGAMVRVGVSGEVATFAG